MRAAGSCSRACFHAWVHGLTSLGQTSNTYLAYLGVVPGVLLLDEDVFSSAWMEDDCVPVYSLLEIISYKSSCWKHMRIAPRNRTCWPVVCSLQHIQSDAQL